MKVTLKQVLFISFILVLLSNVSFSVAEARRGNRSVHPGRNSTIHQDKPLFGYEYQLGKRSSSHYTRNSRKGRIQSPSGQKGSVVRFNLEKLNKNFNDCLMAGVTDPSIVSPSFNDSLGKEMHNLFESRERLLSNGEIPRIEVSAKISSEEFRMINRLATLAIDGSSQNQNRNFCMFSRETAGLQSRSSLDEIRTAEFDSGASGKRGEGIGQITGISKESYSNYVADPKNFEVNRFSCEILVSNVVYLQKIGLVQVTKPTDGYLVKTVSQNKKDLHLNLLNALHNPMVGLTAHKIGIFEAKNRQKRSKLSAQENLCVYKDGSSQGLKRGASCVKTGYVQAINDCVAKMNSKDPEQIASNAQ